MIDHVLGWISEMTRICLAAFDHLPRWLQFALVTIATLAVIAGMHLDDLAREREWRNFRLWLERRRRAGLLRLPRGMR